VADLQIRQSERESTCGDLNAIARQVRMRVRAGQIPYDHILWAAHLGDPVAQLLEQSPRIIIDCPNCRAMRERRMRRNRDPRPRPTPIRVSPRNCMRCLGSESATLERGLIKFAQYVEEFPQRLLIGWATDCVEHQIENLSPRNAMAFQGRYRMPNQPVRDPTLANELIPHIRRWLSGEPVAPILYQLATGNASVYTNLGVASSLAMAVVRSEMEDEARTVRYRCASAVSSAYHAAGGTREERDWQEDRLIYYLLEH